MKTDLSAGTINDSTSSMPAARVARVTDLVGQAGTRETAGRLSRGKVCRPWESYESVDRGERFQVKRIFVNVGASLSLQMYHHPAEPWIVIRGTAQVTRGNETFLLGENESAYIPLGVTHCLSNPGKIPLEIIEVQFGAYLGEDDIVRFEDFHGRVAGSGAMSLRTAVDSAGEGCG